MLLAILWLCSFSANAQYEHWLNRSYPERVGDIKIFIDGLLFNPDSNAILQRIEGLREFGKKHNDKEIMLEATLVNAYYLSIHAADRNRVVRLFQHLIDEAKEKGSLVYEARGHRHLSYYFWNYIKNYELAFEQFLLLDQVLEKMNSDIFPDKLDHLYQIGLAYYHFSEHREAITYFSKALRLPETSFNKIYVNQARNTMGLSYQAIGQLDSADQCFRDLIKANPGNIWEGIASGNLGYSYYLRNNYDAAIPLLEKDISMALKENDYGLASGSGMTLADIYFRRNQTEAARKQTVLCREYVLKSGQYSRYRYLYPLMSKMYAAEGNLSLSNVYLDSAIIVKDSLAREFNALQMMRAAQKAEQVQYRASVTDIENKRRLNKIERNILIAVVMMMIGIAWYWYRLQVKKQQRQEEQMRKAEEELATATRQLNEFARHISEKNKLIDLLQEQNGQQDNELFLQLQQSTILTEEEWDSFKSLFEKVHSGYLRRLKIKLPELSPAEIRFMTLAKLQFTNKEMAATLGVSQQAIRTTWHRLRKKLDLPEEGSLEELVNSI
ncbi:tetratricopeptide repeat protein [Pseudoflavitalea sp. G-6-1-2]|uniref:tetratricopeptide repeat protein n=1 Tax=Pseudoflavitalea sp. G-6-1-2 TaxID=2728841 RepID=UPI00146B306F|nr:tetratricopeptide repeat protein [Pseudoflavitalea sp. G-6-1-2]NML20945.1 tetratricopeptide repeat protein [Pseudoflavitalea sp. G-6-1-2]